jgi:hypothetical protein
MVRLNRDQGAAKPQLGPFRLDAQEVFSLLDGVLYGAGEFLNMAFCFLDRPFVLEASITGGLAGGFFDTSDSAIDRSF